MAQGKLFFPVNQESTPECRRQTGQLLGTDKGLPAVGGVLPQAASCRTWPGWGTEPEGCDQRAPSRWRGNRLRKTAAEALRGQGTSGEGP